MPPARSAWAAIKNFRHAIIMMTAGVVPARLWADATRLFTSVAAEKEADKFAPIRAFAMLIVATIIMSAVVLPVPAMMAIEKMKVASPVLAPIIYASAAGKPASIAVAMPAAMTAGAVPARLMAFAKLLRNAKAAVMPV